MFFGARENLGRKLKSASASSDWHAVVATAEKIWKSGNGTGSTCLSAYRAATALKSNDAAELWIDRGLDIEPDWRMLRLKGDFCRKRGEWHQSKQYYQKALYLAPNEPVVNAMLGYALQHLGKFSEAVHHLRFAVSKEPKAGWYQNIGMCELRMGNFAAAKEALARSYELEKKPNVGAMVADLERRILADDKGGATYSFYDDLYSQETNYNESWENSVYKDIWSALIKILSSKQSQSILDLGCGPGQFSACVAHHLPNVSYLGVDFSAVAIEVARKRVPSFSFSQLTLPVASYLPLGDFDTVVCTEVLEHVDEDIPVLEAIPSGVTSVFSVPNFDAFGHVRIFGAETDVRERYGHLFTDLAVSRHGLGNSGGVIWLASGTRR